MGTVVMTRNNGTSLMTNLGPARSFRRVIGCFQPSSNLGTVSKGNEEEGDDDDADDDDDAGDDVGDNGDSIDTGSLHLVLGLICIGINALSLKLLGDIAFVYGIVCSVFVLAFSVAKETG